MPAQKKNLEIIEEIVLLLLDQADFDVASVVIERTSESYHIVWK